jgi:beta-galactosidase
MSDVRYQDGRFFIDGEPFFVVAADYQYYRDRPENWEPRLRLLQAGHVNTVTFYVPWRHHLKAGTETDFDFTGETKGNRDLVSFLALCARLGLRFVAKPGPFVHSELNIGGLPDVACPSFNSNIQPVRGHEGKPLLWGYDQTQMPSSEDETYDRLALAWLEATGKILAPYAPDPLLAIQLNDETLYCTSNSPPWSYGYDPPDLQFYRQLMGERYGSIDRYNALHATGLSTFGELSGPVFGQRPSVPEELLQYVDWAELQWRLRRDSYARYKQALGLDVPALTNFAGITPPIEENVPDGEPEAPLPEAHAPLYPEWWLAMNRIDADADVYEYGMISWLGVAAYDIPDPKTTELTRGEGGSAVFERYVNTAGRARGINMEENWGFAKLYHPFSKYGIVTVFQTLASVAAGCTGYVVFCGVQHDHWDDDLDRVTKKQHPSFPSDAPIDAEGNEAPLYEPMKQLNAWFARSGNALLQAEQDDALCWLIYPPYAAVSGWLPQEKVGKLPIPRSGVDFETFAASAHQAGYVTTAAELDAVSLESLQEHKACAIRLGFFMDEACQQKLLDYVRGGGTLLTVGELPSVDIQLDACTVLANGLEEGTGDGWSVLGHEALFDPYALGELLTMLDAPPSLSTSDNLRAFVHKNGDERFVFFFHFGRDDAPGFVDFDGRRLELELGCKTCGVVHLRGDALVSALIKGVNELEERSTTVAVRWGDAEIRGDGDLLRFL